MNRAELETLIDQLLDADCSESDFLRLEAQLHVDPEARRLYYERLKLDTALKLEAEDRVASKIIRPVFFQRKLPVLTAMAAAVAILIGGLGWKLGRIGNDQPIAAQSEPLATGFGVLAEESNTVWETGKVARGELLPPGIVHLKEGVAQLELFSGVTVILEGESEFELHSAMEMTVRSGKLRAIVPPPARGFRVRTASGDVVDLGTEFALDVDQDHADVHVLDGEIEWHSLSQPMRKLGNGDSIRSESGGAMKNITSEGDQFTGLGDLQKQQSQKYTGWLAYTETLKSDPRLLAYYPITEPGGWDRTLKDQSGAGRDGTIVRATRAADRWNKSNQALDFGSTGSRVRVDIPGDHSALTLYCWVRISSLDRWYNSLFLTDGHELNEPHWQIMDDGRLFFSVKANNPGKGKKDKHIAYSPSIWTPQLSGQWLQIATVYDSAAKTITHYLNGEQLSRDIIADDLVVNNVRIGAASIGNWGEPYSQDPHFTVRNLNGAIDEFAIFSAALTAEEIANLYTKGKP